MGAYTVHAARVHTSPRTSYLRGAPHAFSENLMVYAAPSNGRIGRMNSRQRKKLHVGEFKQIGFSLKASFKPQSGTYDDFLDEFLTLAEQRGLEVSGSFSYLPADDAGLELLVRRHGVASCTEADRSALLDWLVARAEVANASAGDLADAWYGHDLEA